MCGISPEVAVHALNIDLCIAPVKQKRRIQGRRWLQKKKWID